MRRETLRAKVDAYIRSHPFLRLIQHFCNRATGVNFTSDVDFGLGGLLALLAVPGAFSSILLMDKYSSLLQYLRGQSNFNPLKSCLPDEYFFIVYSMAITGLITLLRWDQLLPDARDFANLATLSLPLPKIFTANMIALASLAGLFAIDINAVSAMVFPTLVTLQSDNVKALVQVAFAHALATVGISAFTFLALVSIQGLLMSALPDRLYRPVALTIRTILLILLSGTLISVFLLPLPFLQVNYASVRAGEWWPPLWFLSLFESMVTPLRSYSPVGSTPACWAIATAAVLTIAGFSLSYKRYFLKIPERQTRLSNSSRTGKPRFRFAIAAFRPILRPGFETACFQFMFRTLMRSETHLLFAGLWTGIGLLLTLQGLRLNSGVSNSVMTQAMLVAPLTFCIFSLGGIRFVFDLSSAAHANWAFRLIAVEGTSLIRAACRKLLLFAGFAPLLFIWFPITVFRSGLRLTSIYFLFHALFIATLVELLLWRYAKVPFTCLFVPNRDRFLRVVAGLLVVLLIILPALARVEATAAENPMTLPIFAGLAFAALIWLYRNGACESETLLYEDGGNDAFVLLKLGNE